MSKFNLLSKDVLWKEALRAFVCMVPMFMASALGKTHFLVALGQGGFFYSSLFLSKNRGTRIVSSIVLLTMGLGFYLVGGNVVEQPLLAIGFTAIVCVCLSFMTGWAHASSIALALVMIYTAGLNSGSPERASSNFLLFAVVLLWSSLISLHKFWDPVEPPVSPKTLDNTELAQQGARMGIGASLALALSYLFDASKLGWAPSAAGNIIRFDEGISKKRAWLRFFGTVGGSLLATIVLISTNNVTILVYVSVFFAVLNGLYKKTKLGMVPLFYTATILLLYSASDPAKGMSTVLARVGLNIAGILVGMIVVIYPFNGLMKRIKTAKPEQV